MAVIRWEPTRELASLQGEMNRLFNTFFDSGASGDSSAARRWVPAMDLVETKDDFVLRADLPGLGPDDVNIELQDRVLTISGERATEQDDQREGYYRVERSFGSFQRSLTLPEGVNADQVTADFKQGVLEVHIPKPEQRRPRRVQIGVGDRQGTIEGTAAS